MTHTLRIKIAAAITTLFLGAISVAGVIAHGNRPTTSTSVTQAAQGRLSKGASQPNVTPTWREQERD
jgi:hypothetical protein